MTNNSSQNSPFFIVGCSRSGTTLLQTLIDSHPNIAIPPESHIYVRFASIFHTYGDFSEQRNRLRFIGDLLRDDRIRKWPLDVTTRDVEQRVSRQSIAGVIEALFSLYAEKHGAARWGDKTPEHIRHLREVRWDFPAAKLIHLVRDGRDVGEAMRRMIWGPVSAVGLAHEWRREVMHWQTFCRTAGTTDTLIVRYEDLVTAPQTALETVLQFIGESYTDTTSMYADTALSRNLGAQGPWHSSLRQGISASKIGVYRQRFTAREIEMFEAIAGGALAEFGYATDHEAPRMPTHRDRLYAFSADRIVRWYRKLHYPYAFWQDLQFRVRIVRRLLLGRRNKRRTANALIRN